MKILIHIVKNLNTWIIILMIIIIIKKKTIYLEFLEKYPEFDSEKFKLIFNCTNHDIDKLVDNIDSEILEIIINKNFSYTKLELIFFKNEYLFHILYQLKEYPELQKKILNLKEEIFIKFNFLIIYSFIYFEKECRKYTKLEYKINAYRLIDLFFNFPKDCLAEFSNKLYNFLYSVIKHYKHKGNKNDNDKSIHSIFNKISFIFNFLSDYSLIKYILSYENYIHILNSINMFRYSTRLINRYSETFINFISSMKINDLTKVISDEIIALCNKDSNTINIKNNKEQEKEKRLNLIKELFREYNEFRKNDLITDINKEDYEDISSDEEEFDIYSNLTPVNKVHKPDEEKFNIYEDLLYSSEEDQNNELTIGDIIKKVNRNKNKLIK